MVLTGYRIRVALTYWRRLYQESLNASTQNATALGAATLVAMREKILALEAVLDAYLDQIQVRPFPNDPERVVSLKQAERLLALMEQADAYGVAGGPVSDVALQAANVEYIKGVVADGNTVKAGLDVDDEKLLEV